MLRGGGAGVIGQDTDPVSDAQYGYLCGRSRPRRDDAMFLIGAQDHQILVRPALGIADQAIILIHRLPRGAAGRTAGATSSSARSVNVGM